VSGVSDVFRLCDPAQAAQGGATDAAVETEATEALLFPWSDNISARAAQAAGAGRGERGGRSTGGTFTSAWRD
jgi:hypothetical protein